MPVEVVVPPLGATVDTLTLIAWYKQEGDFVEKDEPLFAVETDKATLDVEAPSSGFLRRISAASGDEVDSLSRIAFIYAPGESDESLAEFSAPIAAPNSPALSLKPDPNVPIRTEPSSRFFISPRAKRLAEELSIDWRFVQGTGPDGAVVERDVRLYAEEWG